MSSLTLVISTANTDKREFASDGQVNKSLSAASNLLKGIASGNVIGSVVASRSDNDAVQASGTITCASVAADDTVTIGKTTLTAKASPASEDEFDQSGTDTADGADLAAVINAHSVLSKFVYATASAGVVTVTAHQAGSVGNHIALSSSNGTRLAVSGSGYLASGAGGCESVPATFGR